MRSDFVIASVNRWIENGYAETPIHWPSFEEGSTDAAWIEPYVDVAREPSATEYQRVTIEINIFRRPGANTYEIWRHNAALAQLLYSVQIPVRDWPDGGANLLGCVRLFDPVSRYLGPVTQSGARGGLQQINLRVEGVLIGA